MLKSLNLQSQAGETLVETLVAILISALSLVLLASAITSSSNMIRTSNDKLDKYYTENNRLVQRSASDGDVGITLTVSADGDSVTRNYADKSPKLYKNSEAGPVEVIAYGVEKNGAST